MKYYICLDCLKIAITETETIQLGNEYYITLPMTCCICGTDDDHEVVSDDCGCAICRDRLGLQQDSDIQLPEESMTNDSLRCEEEERNVTEALRVADEAVRQLYADDA